jgi:hypothetical protein
MERVSAALLLYVRRHVRCGIQDAIDAKTSVRLEPDFVPSGRAQMHKGDVIAFELPENPQAVEARPNASRN